MGVTLHKKRVHGNTLLVKKIKHEQRITTVRKVKSDIIRSDSISDNSRSGSPSPKKINCSKKKETNP